MGNPNFSTDKMEAMLCFLGQTHFKRIAVQVSDTLYRHNLMREGMNPDLAYEKSLAIGQKWIKKHEKVLDRYGVDLMFWDDMLKHKNYAKALEEVEKLYADNNSFKRVIDEDILFFHARTKKLLDKKAAQHSMNYLFEEIACDTILFAEYADFAECYPGGDLKSYDYLRRKNQKDIFVSIYNTPYIRLVL